MVDGIVSTSSGRVRGVEANGCWAFLGLRYGAPVAGAARFSAPRPPAPWTGIRDADQYSPIAPQPASGLGSYVPGDPMEQGEDCLSLNIWTPLPDSGARPVLVFLHGGAFLTGAGSSVMYRGESFSRRGVVVVTVNYRLGALGFLAHPDFERDGGRFANRGLLDQIAALEWVRGNIAGFGGDPARITVAGESAGAMSVADLISLGRVRRMLCGAILESGAALASSPEVGLRRAARFAELLGLASLDLGRLATVPIEELLAAQDALTTELGGPASIPFRPVVDGTLFSEHPERALARGATRELDLLVGTNRDEFRFFTFAQHGLGDLGDEELGGLVRPYLETFGRASESQRVIEGYREAIGARGGPTGSREVFESIGTDLVFRVPLIRLLSAHAVHGGRGFCYRFDWPSPFAQGSLGACHALELPFVFGTIDNPIIAMFSGSGGDASALSEEMQSGWASFAATGTPANEGAPNWPAYQPADRATRVFGGTSSLEFAPGEAERNCVESVIPPYGVAVADGVGERTSRSHKGVSGT